MRDKLDNCQDNRQPPVRIISYQGLNDVSFGSKPERIMNSLGKPRQIYHAADSYIKYHYEGFIVYCDVTSEKNIGIEMIYPTPFLLNSEPFEWSSEGVRHLCSLDGNPLIYSGSVVLLNLGVSLPLPEDMDNDSVFDRTFFAFQEGTFDKAYDRLLPYKPII